MVAYTNFISDARLHRYALSLLDRGDRVDIIGLGIKGKPYQRIINGANVYNIQTRNFTERTPLSYLKNVFQFFILSSFALTRLHLKNRYDLIHYHNIPDFGVFCTFIPKLMGIKVILDIHDLVPEFYMRKFNVHENHLIIKLLKWIEKISARFADHVIIVTELWRQKIIKRSVEPSRCTVIMNVPYTGLFVSKKKYKKKKDTKSFLLSYHGNLAEQNGVDVTIKAMNIVNKKYPHISLQIIGEGRQKKNLIELMHKYNLQKKIKFIDNQPIQKIPDIVGIADAGIDPKREGVYAGETLSVKIMEYLQLEIPAIVSRTKTASTYFNENTVMFFQPGNEKDLARCIIELYKSSALRKSLLKNAKIFNEEYNWEKYKKIYYDLLNRLINR
jgi:glycosyltransferase involved in cell wall biosynthesis